MVGQLLHGSRQLVPWGVPLSRRTSATRIRCYKCHRRLPRYVSGRKEGTTTCQHGAYTLGNTHPTMAKNNGMQTSNGKQIPEISPQFRLRAATRPHEVGIGSNRRSEGCGEYVLGSCTHRPSSQQSWGRLKAVFTVEAELSDGD